MSTGCLKKPSRPPPPPPKEDLPSQQFRRSASYTTNRINSTSDYIKISDCYTGFRPDQCGRQTKPLGFKSRASTSFSTQLPSQHFQHSSHQKSRSLTDNHLGSYLCLELPSSSKNSAPTPPSIVYKQVDFVKTDALTSCKVERNQRVKIKEHGFN